MLAGLRDDLKARRFVPDQVRQKAIPKPGGKVRHLGIPTARDRVVQASLKLVLEPIFEADFKPCSYGFRPRRRAQDAIAEIHFFASPSRNYLWVFEADIKACFDEIDHQALMGRVRDRIEDKRVLALIKAFLRAGVLSEDGVSRNTNAGTPQGGILSPLLANIALSVLDEHFEAKYEALGSAWTRCQRRRAGAPVMKLIRYADDFVVLVAGSREHAEAFTTRSAVSSPRSVCAYRKRRRGSATSTRGSTSWAGVSNVEPGEAEPDGGRSTPIHRKVLALADGQAAGPHPPASHRTLADLLSQVNPLLRGWCNYFNHGVCKRTFGYVDHYTWWKIVTWVRKRHAGRTGEPSAAATSQTGRSATTASTCSGHARSPSLDTDTGARRSPHHGRARQQDHPNQRHDPVESRMQ